MKNFLIQLLLLFTCQVGLGKEKVFNGFGKVYVIEETEYEKNIKDDMLKTDLADKDYLIIIWARSFKDAHAFQIIRGKKCKIILATYSVNHGQLINKSEKITERTTCDRFFGAKEFIKLKSMKERLSIKGIFVDGTGRLFVGQHDSKSINVYRRSPPENQAIVFLKDYLYKLFEGKKTQNSEME